MQKSKRSKHKIMKEECTINQKNVKEKTEAEKESGTPWFLSSIRDLPDVLFLSGWCREVEMEG